MGQLSYSVNPGDSIHDVAELVALRATLQSFAQ